MERGPGSVYAYIMILFSIVVLAWSVWAMYSAITFYQQGNLETFYFYAIASSIAVVLAVSSLMQMRRRLTLLHSMSSRILTVVQCANCGFKVIRNFGIGDYVHKEVGKCQQCSGTTRINSIYAEEPKKGGV